MPPQMPTTYSPSFHPTPPNPAFFRPLSTSQDTSSNPYTSNLVSCIGLGASSFSTFFPSPTAKSEWIKTIHHALKSHINVIDTAPWYGHGTSEETLGAALATVPRSVYYIHTKVGRYEADVKNMFDFSAEKTKESVLLSIKRMGCGHIDLIQIHDPEFALDLSQILAETLPALAKLRSEGLVTAIGITGYPLSVQREIIERSDVKIDVSLTYGHVCLNDNSLFTGGPSSFHSYCKGKGIPVMSAAPLSMGLLTYGSIAEWHPAGLVLREACGKARGLCVARGVDLARVAIGYAVGVGEVPVTFLGMKSVEEVDFALGCVTVEEGTKAIAEELCGDEYFGLLRGEPGWDWRKDVDAYQDAVRRV